ncbi:hypothetical protein ACLOJK_011634 [Asimina triloba]
MAERPLFPQIPSLLNGLLLGMVCGCFARMPFYRHEISSHASLVGVGTHALHIAGSAIRPTRPTVATAGAVHLALQSSDRDGEDNDELLPSSPAPAVAASRYRRRDGFSGQPWLPLVAARIWKRDGFWSPIVWVDDGSPSCSPRSASWEIAAGEDEFSGQPWLPLVLPSARLPLMSSLSGTSPPWPMPLCHRICPTVACATLAVADLRRLKLLLEEVAAVDGSLGEEDDGAPKFGAPVVHYNLVHLHLPLCNFVITLMM